MEVKFSSYQSGLGFDNRGVGRRPVVDGIHTLTLAKIHTLLQVHDMALQFNIHSYAKRLPVPSRR